DPWRAEPFDAIDAVSANERGRKPRSALDEEARDAAFSQKAERFLHVHMLIRALRHVDEFDPAFLEGGAARSISACHRQQPDGRTRARIAHELRCQGQAK